MTGRLHDHVENEEARLSALRDLRLLDTPPSESFDRLTRLASRLVAAPVSTISLTDRDRQWFKSKVGVDLSEIPREKAPCNYAIQGSDVFVVPDLLKDERFHDSPLAQAGVRFYAGAPLFTREGYGIGTLAVVDDTPRDLTEEERAVLRDLAAMVMSQVEIQNAVGRVDPSSGYANQQAMFETLDALGRSAQGATGWGVLVDLVASLEATHAQRALGSDYAEALTRGALRAVARDFGNRAELFHVGPTRIALLLSPETTIALDDALDRLRSALDAPIDCGGVPIAPAPTFGTYVFTHGSVAPRDVLRRLLNAVEDARRAEDRTAEYCAVRDDQNARRFRLLTDFKATLESPDELQLHFQPRVAVADLACKGAEALLRWRHPLLGPVPPDEFVPYVERTALGRPMTDWVVRHALCQCGAWRASGRSLGVSINASALNLEERDFADRLMAAIEGAGVDPHEVELEFTESAVARNSAAVIAQLSVLRGFGLDIAIDDFGTGYSNLSYLQQLPATVLKIDRQFIRDLDTSARDRKLVRTVIAMARDLGCRVVAEGVETCAALEILAGWGCDEVQGFLLARPMPAADLEAWLDARGSALRAAG